MSITYLEAIREAQAKALRDDPRVYIYGQDVGDFGGAFKATKDLAKEFPGRVLDSPISEDAMVGSVVGAAIEGMRPIVEMQYSDRSYVDCKHRPVTLCRRIVALGGRECRSHCSRCQQGISFVGFASAAAEQSRCAHPLSPRSLARFETVCCYDHREGSQDLAVV